MQRSQLDEARVLTLRHVADAEEARAEAARGRALRARCEDLERRLALAEERAAAADAARRVRANGEDNAPCWSPHCLLRGCEAGALTLCVVRPSAQGEGGGRRVDGARAAAGG